MFSISNLKETALNAVGNKGLMAKKISPEILIGVGIVAGVGAVIGAGYGTLKARQVIGDHVANLKVINRAYEVAHEEGHDGLPYSDKDKMRDTAITFAWTVRDLMKVYWPMILCGAISISAVLKSHDIMVTRTAALTAAYKLVSESFADYRQRVVDELGEDRERLIRFNGKEETTSETIVAEDGTKTKKKTKNRNYDPNFKSDYARFFDESCGQWMRDPIHNLALLKMIQNEANDKLKARGHLFLNEVYDMLGFPRTQAGAIVGWVYSGGADEYVDFDIYNPENTPGRDFVNGYNPSILLDFNVDGIIYDLIGAQI